jgi:hypothetical protein
MDLLEANWKVRLGLFTSNLLQLAVPIWDNMAVTCKITCRYISMVISAFNTFKPNHIYACVCVYVYVCTCMRASVLFTVAWLELFTDHGIDYKDKWKFSVALKFPLACI